LPYRTTENVIDGLVCTFVDVSTIKALQKQQQRLLDTLRRTPIRVFEQDQELRFTWASGEVFGVEPNELLGKSEESVFSEMHHHVQEAKKRVLNTGTAEHARLELPSGRAQGTYELYIQAKRGESGECGECGESGESGEIVGLSCVTVKVKSLIPAS
jgi:two-component system CheB/CheR fusion protein